MALVVYRRTSNRWYFIQAWIATSRKEKSNEIEQQEEIEEGVFITAGETLRPETHKLDSIELVDYLKNQGQWTTNIITENPPKS